MKSEVPVEALAIVVKNCEDMGGEELKNIRIYLNTLSPEIREKVAEHIQFVRDAEKRAGPICDL